MYNGIGITTTRGTGTSGHIRRNLASIPNRQRRRRVHPVNPHSTLRQRLKQTSSGLQAHEQRRRIELQVMELRESLENRGVNEAEILERTNKLRDKLVSKFEKEREKKEKQIEKEKESDRHVEVPRDVLRGRNGNDQVAVENQTSPFKVDDLPSRRSPVKEVDKPLPPPVSAPVENATDEESNQRQRYLQHMQNLNNRRFQRAKVQHRPQRVKQPQREPQTAANIRNRADSTSNEQQAQPVREQPRTEAIPEVPSRKRDVVDHAQLSKSEPIRKSVHVREAQYRDAPDSVQPANADVEQLEKEQSNAPTHSTAEQREIHSKVEHSDDEEKFFYSRKSVHAYEHSPTLDDAPHEQPSNGELRYEHNAAEARKEPLERQNVGESEVKEKVETLVASEASVVEKNGIVDANAVKGVREDRPLPSRERRPSSRVRRAPRVRTPDHRYEGNRSRSPSTRSASIRRARYKRGNQSPLSDEFPRRGRKNIHYERYSSDLYYSDSSRSGSRSRSQSRDSSLSYDSARYSRYSRSPSPVARRKRDDSRRRERRHYRSPEKLYDSSRRRCRYSRDSRKSYEDSYYEYRYYSRSPRSDVEDDDYSYRRRSKRDELDGREDEERHHRRKRRRSSRDYRPRYVDRSISPRAQAQAKRGRSHSPSVGHHQWSRRHSYDNDGLEGRNYDY